MGIIDLFGGPDNAGPDQLPVYSVGAISQAFSVEIPAQQRWRRSTGRPVKCYSRKAPSASCDRDLRPPRETYQVWVALPNGTAGRGRLPGRPFGAELGVTAAGKLAEVVPRNG